MAYVILGHCKDFGQRADEVEYLEMEINYKLPAHIEFNEIALGKWQNMTVVKFPLDAPTSIPRNSKQPPWEMLDEDISIFSMLRPKFSNVKIDN